MVEHWQHIITDKPQNREGLPVTLSVDYVPFDPFQEKYQKHVDALEHHIKRYPGQHACMKFELIQGEGGFNVGSKPFFKEIVKWLKEQNIPVYVDETQHLVEQHNCLHFNYLICKMMSILSVLGNYHKFVQRCIEKVKAKPGLVKTFTSSTGAIEASKVILNELVDNGYLGKNGKIAKLHGYFARQFRKLEKSSLGQVVI